MNAKGPNKGNVDKVFRVLLVEDDLPVLERLGRAIEADAAFGVEAACDTLAGARTALDSFTPDVLVTDLRLPDGDGIDLIREVRRDFPGTEILVVTVLGEERTVVSAIMAGATGYLLKDAHRFDIAACLHTLVDGGSPISSSVARYILSLARGNGASSGDPPKVSVEALTDREKDVLLCFSKGFTYSETAAILKITENTVRTHIKHIYRKLEVNSRSEAVYEAIRQGLLHMD